MFLYSNKSIYVGGMEIKDPQKDPENNPLSLGDQAYK